MENKKSASKFNKILSKKFYGSQKEDINQVIRKKRMIILICTFILMIIVLSAMTAAIILANERMNSLNQIIDNENNLCLVLSIIKNNVFKW